MVRGYWIRRFVVAFVVATLALFAAHMLRGYSVPDALGFGALWGVVAAAIFTLIGYARYRRNPACMLPRARKE